MPSTPSPTPALPERAWGPARIALAHRIVNAEQRRALARLMAGDPPAAPLAPSAAPTEPPWWEQAVHAEQGYVWCDGLGWVPRTARLRR